jgi:hypothetical protein
MKRLFASLLLFAAAAIAGAQSLPQGVTLDSLQATRDYASGFTMITGALHNNTGRMLKNVSVVFTLQDAQGSMVGSTSEITYNLPNGATWQIRAIASQPFARFSATEVKAE